jgi:hypothetical protein
MSKWIHTPWGTAQDTNEIAEGITFYSTAGHGGMKLSPERHAKVQKKFPNFKTFAGGAWYEEDCDVMAVVATFPECFKAETVAECIEMVRKDEKYFGKMVE